MNKHKEELQLELVEIEEEQNDKFDQVMIELTIIKNLQYKMIKRLNKRNKKVS